MAVCEHGGHQQIHVKFGTLEKSIEKPWEDSTDLLFSVSLFKKQFVFLEGIYRLMDFTQNLKGLKS